MSSTTVLRKSPILCHAKVDTVSYSCYSWLLCLPLSYETFWWTFTAVAQQNQHFATIHKNNPTPVILAVE